MKVLTSRVVLFAIVSALIVGNPMVSRAEIDDVYKTVASKAYVDDEVSTKQNVIPHVAAGTTATKIVTYPGAGASDGAIGELTVDTSSFYTTDDSHVPSSKLVASRDVRSHTVNGAPLSNMASYFYGEGDGDSDVLAKTVLINSIDSRENESTPTGQMITVQPNKTASKGNITLKLNKFNASQVYYKGNVLNDDDASKVWNSEYPSTFVFDGSNWVFMGNGQLDTDTTYPSMSVSEGTIGTATTQRSLTAQNLKQIIQGTKLYGVDITATSQVNANNTITESIGQLQGQINAIPNYGTNTVNGAPISNSASVFFDGAAGGSANSPDKSASIPSITTLSAGTIITVQPQITSDIIEGATYSLRLNNFDRATIYYNGAALDAKDAPNIWNAKYPSTFVYDGTNWVFAGYGFDKDTNTTYASMGVSEGTTGTATAQRSLTAQNLKQIIQGTTLTGVDTTATAEVTASDTVTAGIGKLQGQVSTKQNKIAATSDGTDNTPNYVYDATTNPTADGSVVTTGATDGTVGQRGIATAPVSDGNGGYSNGDWLPTVNAMMSQINDATETLVWDSTRHPAAINAYNTAFGNGNYDWPAGTGDHLVTGSFLANALAEKQMILPGLFEAISGNTDLRGRGNTVIRLGTEGRAIRMYTTAAGNEALTTRRQADAVITYINGTKTLADFQTSNFGAEDSPTINKNNNYIKEALVSLETLKDVYSELNTKITNNALPTGTAGTVVTYNGTNAETGVQEFTETAIYDTANAYDASTDADKLATAGFVETKQNKIDATANTYTYDATTNPTADGSVVTTGATDGTVGQRGIATAPVSDGNGGYSNGDWLPTVNAMMSQINDATETLVWDSTRHPAAINAYNKVFGNGTYDWPAGTGDHLVTGSFLANALAEKQMILPGKFNNAKGNTVIKLGTVGRAIPMYTTAAGNEALTNLRNAPAIINYVNGTVATNADMTTFTSGTFGTDSDTNQKYIKEALVSLETLKDVYSELNTKITNNALPTGTAGTVVTYNGTNAETGVQEFTETAIYDTANAYNASTDADKLATAGFVETKQNKIAATANTYTYDTTTNPTADGSVVTTGATDGTVGQRGIATAPNYDTNDNLTNGDWLPTMSAVKSMVSGSDVSSHLVNGQALSNNQITLYGTSDTTASGGMKRVILYDYSDPDNPTPIQMDALVPGTVIVIKPEYTATQLLRINIENIGRDGQAPVRYNGGSVPSKIMPKIWNENYPTVWVYDGTDFNYVSGGLDSGLQTVDWDENRHPTAINAYNTDFDGETGHWRVVEENGLVKGETFANALALKQNILPAQASGAPVTIPTYPAYGTSDGVIGKMYLDTSSLSTADNEHFPSSKLIRTTLSSYVPKSDVLNTNDTNSYLADDNSAPSWATTNGVASLYRVPGAASGSNWAATAMSKWANDENVPTMDTLANSLAGLYDAVGDSINNQILNYTDTSLDIGNGSVPIPSQIAYTGESKLDDGTQLLWLPQLNNAGVEEATRLLKNYSDEKIVPTMDELAHALDGVLQTHETTREWQEVVDFYGVPSSSLFDVAKAIEGSDNNAVALNRSGYLQTFAPTLEALMNESYALYQAIDTKQNKLSGTNGNLVTYGATPGATGSKAIATTITDDANTVPNTAAVYEAVGKRQFQIPANGKYIDSRLTKQSVSDWTAREVKGINVVVDTETDGAIGKRQIFEAGTTYTNDAETNIQIATIGAVMENTFTKTCAEYKPGTIGETAANCWLWEITSNNVTPATCSVNGTGCTSDTDCCSGYCNNARPSVCAEQTAACLNPTSCRSDRDCCDGYSCIGNSTSGRCVNFSSGT